MHTLMDSMMKNNSQFHIKCLIGDGITSNLRKISYRIWCMMKVCSTTQKLRRQLFPQRQKEKKRNNLDTDQNIDFIIDNRILF